MKRGSITLQLCLVLGIILSLVLYSIRSVRIAEGRVLISSAAEQGLYSLFAQYDRDLWEDYGLLFLDGGYSGRDLQLGALCREVEEAAGYIVDPGKDSILAAGKGLSGLELTGCEPTGYLLATDNEGAAFQRQVGRVMKDTLGVRALETLKDQLTEQLDTAEQQAAYWESADPEGTMEEYEALKKQTEPEEAETAVLYRAPPVPVLTAESGEESPEPEVPEDFENPIEIARSIRKLGLLSAAVPDVTKLSGFSLEQDALVSGRALQQGMGMVQNAEDGLVDKILLLEFLVENFPCYTSDEQGEGLKYQVEYALGGKDSDIENLKSVLTKLLLIREGSNFLFLMTDSEKGAQADQAALILSTVLLVPEMKDLIAVALKLCWAYGESIMDLKTLLSGGKIPLLKDKESWQLSLGSLGTLLLGGQGEGKSSEKGLDYRWYLRILLLAENSGSLADAAMDLTEYNIRVRRGRTGFSLDSCLDVLEVRLSGKVDGQEISLVRSYGYDMEE